MHIDERIRIVSTVGDLQVPKKYRGRMVMVYDAGSRRNEPVDCAVGSLAALKISLDHYGLNLEELSEKVAYPESTTTVENDFLEAGRRLRVN